MKKTNLGYFPFMESSNFLNQFLGAVNLEQ